LVVVLRCGAARAAGQVAAGRRLLSALIDAKTRARRCANSGSFLVAI